MPADFQDLRRDISQFLIGLRNAIDRPYRTISRGGPQTREQFTQAMLMIEEARVRFNSYVRFRDEPTEEEWGEARDGLLKFINSFLASSDVDPVVFDRPFRVAFPGSQRDRLPPFLTTLVDTEASVGEALVGFRKLLEASSAIGGIQTTMEFADLGRVVPRQQVAPARFQIVEGRIVVSKDPPAAADEDRANISSALEHVKESGDALIKSLENSNCDRRLLSSVSELHKQLKSDGNIVKIGLTNLACGVMCAQFSKELPDAVCAMFTSYSTSVSMYVAQFPEWEQFTQRAASIELDEDDFADIDSAAELVVSQLEAHPDLADPEVPQTIKLVREFMHRPGNTAKRAAFAMLRTIENLVASIVRHSVSVLGKTAEKTVDQLSSAASKTIVTLLGIALLGAATIGPAAASAGTPWLRQVVEVVQKQIEQLK